MTQYSTNFFGASIDTGELTNGSVTLAKLDQTGTANKVLTAQGVGSAPIWNTPPYYTNLGTATLGGDAASLTLTVVTTGIRELLIRVEECYIGAGNPTLALQFNADSGANYLSQSIGSGGNASLTTGCIIEHSASTTQKSAGMFHVSNVSTQWKMVNGAYYDAGGGVDNSAGLWKNNAEITEIKLIASASVLKTGTKITCWGLALP